MYLITPQEVPSAYIFLAGIVAGILFLDSMQTKYCIT